MSVPKVSVIMNTLNEDRILLDKAIMSYLTQSGVELELIISTVSCDRNLSYIMDKYKGVKFAVMDESKHPISLGRREPIGAYLQLNNALPFVTGDFFCYASSNDVAYDNKLLTESKTLIKTGKHICYSNFYLINEHGQRVRRTNFQEYNFQAHLKGNFVSDCSMMTRYIFDKYLPFDLSVKNLGYWDMWLRVYEGEGNVFELHKTPTWGYRNLKSSLRVDRLKDKAKVRQENEDRRLMLLRHKK